MTRQLQLMFIKTSEKAFLSGRMKSGLLLMGVEVMLLLLYALPEVPE
jgi:hypothetical protein